jgi:hypothetical protein
MRCTLYEFFELHYLPRIILMNAIPNWVKVCVERMEPRGAML